MLICPTNNVNTVKYSTFNIRTKIFVKNNIALVMGFAEVQFKKGVRYQRYQTVSLRRTDNTMAKRTNNDLQSI